MTRSQSLNRAKLALEALESRWCPAIAWSNAGGVLSVSGDPVGDLTIGHTANGVWEIIDNGNTLASNISANGGLKVTLNGDNDVLNIRVDGGASNISGSVSLNTGNGEDEVNFNSSGNVVNLAGMLLINTGNGFDRVDLSRVVGGDVTIQGLTSINMGLDNLDFLTIPATVTIQGDLVTQEANSVFLGGIVEGKATVTFTSAAAPGNDFTSDLGSSIGSLSIVGSAGEELITLNGTVLNSATIYLGNGANQTDFDSAGLNGAVIGGSLQYNGGTGRDTLTIGGQLNGSLTANFGTAGVGADANDFNFNTSGVIQGSVTLSADGGETNMDFDAGSVIAGNLTVTTRSTNNTLNFNGTLAGSRFTYNGGGGRDQVTWNADGGAAYLYVLLGAGGLAATPETFTLSSTFYNGGLIDGGLGTDDFTGSVPLIGLTKRGFEL